MRKFGEYDLKKLSDSRLLYLRSPPKFTYITVAFILIILLGILVWGAYSVRTEEIHGAGIITAEGSTVISPQITGVIIGVYFKEGDEISQGDTIIELDHSDVDLTIKQIDANVNKLNARISYINTFISATYDSTPTQPFINSEDQAEFYALFINYLSNLSSCTGIQNAIDSLNHQIRSSLLSQKDTLQSSLTANEDTLSSYQLTLLKHYIYAPGHGIVHFDSNIRLGMTVQAGIQLGSISSQDDIRHIEMIITASERPMLDVGQKCRFTINGLSQNNYGSITGTISSISNDAIITQDGAYFRVIIDYSANYISSFNGMRIQLTNGMTVSIWIIYEESTYLHYWMSKIGLGELFE